VESVRDLISRKSPEDVKVIEAAIAHPESKEEEISLYVSNWQTGQSKMELVLALTHQRFLFFLAGRDALPMPLGWEL
jgi:hypothetical protein